MLKKVIFLVALILGVSVSLVMLAGKPSQPHQSAVTAVTKHKSQLSRRSSALYNIGKKWKMSIATSTPTSGLALALPKPKPKPRTEGRQSTFQTKASHESAVNVKIDQSVASQSQPAKTAISKSVQAKPVKGKGAVTPVKAPTGTPSPPSTTQAGNRTTTASSTPAPAGDQHPTAQSQSIQVSQSAQQAPHFQPHTLYINGQAVSYFQGNMQMTAAPANMAATWGGQTAYRHDNNQNAHFIGHNPGVFSGLLNLGVGSQIVVTDAAGVPKTYTVGQIARVDDNARTASGVDLWQHITGTEGGQRITLQTCLSETENLIVFAY